jgi:arsenical resistance operon trans-acting repressor ArsD
MTVLQVFDRPMCCPTGVCGPNVDAALPRFAADLEWLRAQGVAVERYNLAQQAAAFTRDAGVAAALKSEDVACLPLFRVDGEIVFRGKYPSRSMLARWCGVDTTKPLPAAKRSCCGPDCCS